MLLQRLLLLLLLLLLPLVHSCSVRRCGADRNLRSWEGGGGGANVANTWRHRVIAKDGKQFQPRLLFLLLVLFLCSFIEVLHPVCCCCCCFSGDKLRIGGDVPQNGRALDRHAADAGSIPRCGKGFFSQSQLSVQTLFRCLYTSVRNRVHLHLCAR